jgi:AraC family transcriptional regulator
MTENWIGELWGVEAVRARLAYYPPGVRQDTHRHREPHISVVVAGSFRETTPQDDRIVCQGGVGFRADAASHAVCFGPAGALILTVAARDWIAEGLPRAGVRWVGTAPAVARQLVSLARSGGEEACEELADRLFALWAGPSRPGRNTAGEPPAWLRTAADRLLSQPDGTSIAGLARGLGVHRVHLARSFQQYYGMPPSIFRRRAMASRALSAALAGRTRLADAAAEAGFADQSHMSRVVREWCTLGVGDLRRLLGTHVTSIQASTAAKR